MNTKLNAKLQKEGYDSFIYYATEDIKDDFCDFHLAKLTPIFDRYVCNPKRILEIGFGSGRLMTRVQALYPDAAISGTEVRPSLVELMQNKGYDCHVVDDEVIPGNVNYDLIYGTSVLHHFSAPYKFIRHAFSRLNSGGVLIFSCEPHLFNLPCIAYSTVRGIWHLEKHLLKLTRAKVEATAKSLTDDYRFYYDDASYFPVFPIAYRLYKLFRLTHVSLFSEFHLVLVRD